MIKKSIGPLKEAREFASIIRKIAPNIREIIFSNEGSKGREPLVNVSQNPKNLIFAYWKDKKNKIIEISADQPGYDILAPKSMRKFFSDETMGTQPFFLNVTHLDVSQTEDFSECFSYFGAFEPVEIIGLEVWNVSQGKNFFRMFYYAFYHTKNVDLNLSNWHFIENKEFSMGSMFNHAGCDSLNIKLNVKGWNLKCCSNFRAMFQSFGEQAKKVELIGLDTWRPGDLVNMNNMFQNAIIASGYCVDLSNWSKSQKLQAMHRDFSSGTFFQIKEPRWAS